jgi:hypothetical protein
VYDFSMIEMAPALWDRVRVEPTATIWLLHVSNPEAIRQQLTACGFSAEQIQTLMATLTPVEGGYALHPSDDFILAVEPRIRHKWYAVLAAEPDNPDYTYPNRFRQRGLIGWLEESNVEAAPLDLARRLIFTSGELQLMADMQVLQRKVTDPETMRRLACVLSRETTVIAYLLVGPRDNIDQLAEYWGYPDRQDAVRTLLRATQRSGFDRPIPLSMLLPRFARDRVHRYWRAGDPALSYSYYTSLNFFTDRPDENCTNAAYAAQVIERDYIKVTLQPRLGDLVLVQRGPNEVIHTCNYIADGIVFTKNGGTMGHPWMFAQLEDVMDFFSYPKPIKISFLRRRDLATQ